MNLKRTNVRSVLSCKLLAAAVLLAASGCQLAADTAGTGEAGQVQTFIADFIRQALTAFVL